MTYRAARAVECRSETFFGEFDLEKVVQPEPELLELHGRDAGQRVPGLRRACLGERQRRGEERECRAEQMPDGHGCVPHSAISVPRMNEWPAPHSFEHSKT